MQLDSFFIFFMRYVRSRYGIGVLLAVCFLCAGPAASTANTVSGEEELQQLQDRLERQELERQRLLQEERRRRQLQLPEPDAPAEEETPDDAGRCVDISDIQFSGVTLYDEDVQASWRAPYIGRCLTGGDVEQVLATVTQAYRADGYVTSRAYVLEQSLENGLLIVTVLEGQIGAFTLERMTERELYFAFPLSQGDILNMRDVEQGLDQMNRLISNSVSVDIAPGEAQGRSRLILSNERSKRWQVSFGQDNSGDPSTGLQQNNLLVAIDNLLGINDYLSVSYRRTAINYGIAQKAQSASLSYDVPFGRWNFAYTGSYNDYSSLVSAPAQDFLVSGDGHSHQVTISRLVHRDSESKTSVEASLRTGKNHNYIDNGLIEASSFRKTSGTVTVAHNRRFLGGILSMNAGFSRGLPLFNARKDASGQDSDAPKTQYSKWTLGGGYSRQVSPFGLNINLSTSATAMYSPDTLFGSDRMSIGGLSSVRGFREETLSGDWGYYVRNELSVPIPNAGAWNVAVLDQTIGQLSPFVSLDWGEVGRHVREPGATGVLSGVSMGLRTRSPYLSFELVWSRGLARPALMPGSGEEVNFNLKFKF